MTLFCNLFMESPSYVRTHPASARGLSLTHTCNAIVYTHIFSLHSSTNCKQTAAWHSCTERGVKPAFYGVLMTKMCGSHLSTCTLSTNPDPLTSPVCTRLGIMGI